MPSNSACHRGGETASSSSSAAGATSRPRVSKSAARGTCPMAVSVACATPVQRSMIQRNTRTLSLQPRQKKLAGGTLAKSVHVKYGRRGFELGADRDPMRPIVSEVVAREGFHRHRIAAYDTDGGGGRGGGLGGQLSAHPDPV